MMIFLLTFKVSRHMTHKKIALYCTYFLMKSIILCDKAHNRDGALKTARGNLYVIFLNSAFLLDIPSIVIKLAGNVFYDILEGSMSQDLDLGPGYFFMLCRNYGTFFSHYYFHFGHKNITRTYL